MRRVVGEGHRVKDGQVRHDEAGKLHRPSPLTCRWPVTTERGPCCDRIDRAVRMMLVARTGH